MDDALPIVQWAKKFLEDQGYELEVILKENNKNTMLLMRNKKLLLGKGTKHLDVRYFYVKDLIDKEYSKSIVLQIK